MKFKKFFNAAVATAVTAVALPLSAGSASAIGEVVVNQGDGFYNSRGDHCTIGFVDGNKAYTAAHCFSNLNDKSVYDAKRNYIGKATPNPAYRYDNWKNRMIPNDLAVIQLADNVTSGSNVFSGNNIFNNPKPGDKACLYGDKTHRVICGKYKETDQYGNHITYTDSSKGDSGGPVWVEGKGFLGYVSVRSVNRGTHAVTNVSSDHNWGFFNSIPNERVPGKSKDISDLSSFKFTVPENSSLPKGSNNPFAMSSF